MNSNIDAAPPVTFDRRSLQDVPCPICGGYEPYVIIRPAAYPSSMTVADLLHAYRSSSDKQLMDQLVRCRGCNLVYTHPRIRDDIILSSYADATDPVFVSQNAWRVATFKTVLQRVMRRLDWHPTRADPILDVGCAGGAFLRAAADLGFEVNGVEPSRWLCEKGKELYGLNLLPGTLEEQSFPDRSFQMISYWDVIEHITHPERELRHAHRLLKDDGFLLINFPDHGSWARRLLGWRWPFFLSVHLYYFTRQTMTRFLQRQGFHVLWMSPYFQTLELAYVLNRVASVMPFFSPVARLAGIKPLRGFPLRYHIGQTLVVAKKAI